MNPECNPPLRKTPADENYDASWTWQRAVTEWRKDVLAYLLGHNADGKFTDENIAWLLKVAVCKDDEEVVELILGNGANPNRFGQAPLTYAVARTNINLVTMLLKHGAEVDAVTSGGWTHLHTAVGFDAEEIAALLLKNGANPNLKDEIGGTPLHLAVLLDKVNMVKVLLKYGAQVNILGLIGTALHDAALLGRNEIVKVLLANGADVNIKDHSGKTPLDVATVEAAEILKHHQSHKKDTP